MRAHLAVCNHGFLGLITSETKVATPYSGNYLDTSWTGIHITEYGGKKIGDRWQSKEPKIICHLGEPSAGRIMERFNSDSPKWARYPGDHTDINYVSVDGDWTEEITGRRWNWDGAKWVQG